MNKELQIKSIYENRTNIHDGGKTYFVALIVLAHIAMVTIASVV